MKKLLFIIIPGLFFSPVMAQEIVNLVLVGEHGITTNIKEANSFVVVKKFPGNFQRLDYKMHGPVVKVRSYSDSTLTLLDGPFYEYAPAGYILKSGYYSKNLKVKDWYYYNDTGKVILEEKYENNVLIQTINPDTIKKEPGNDKLKDGEKEAQFRKGNSAWISYLTKNLNADVGNQSLNGGQVRVGFTVNTAGACVDIYLRKSVEFVLDEEATRVIRNSPPWEPAVQDGRKVNAYRVQPIGFARPE